MTSCYVRGPGPLHVGGHHWPVTITVLKAEALNPRSYAQWKEEYGPSSGVLVQAWK